MILSLLLSAHLGFAQQPWDPYAPEHLEQTGKLVTLKIVPGNKEVNFYVAGKKAASFKKYKMNASVFSEGKSQPVHLTFKDDHYVTSSPLKGDELRLKVNGEKPEDSEEFLIPLKKH